MAQAVSPTVARRRVRLALREAEDSAGSTPQRVTDRMEWSFGKVTRIENGDTTIAPMIPGHCPVVHANFPITDNGSFDLLLLDADNGEGIVLYREHGLTDEVMQSMSIRRGHRDRYDKVWQEAGHEADTIDFVQARITRSGLPTQDADRNVTSPAPHRDRTASTRGVQFERRNMNNVMPSWQKSSYCANATCVEVAKVDADTYLIRDSKQPENPALSFTGPEWTAFVAGVRAGEFKF
jgi:hypothetical protein